MFKPIGKMMVVSKATTAQTVRRTRNVIFEGTKEINDAKNEEATTPSMSNVAAKNTKLTMHQNKLPN